jgi:hypothetical protein
MSTRPFTISELVKLMRLIEPAARAAAAARQAHGRTAPGRLPVIRRAKGCAMDCIAACLGKDRATLRKAAAIVAAAERDPSKFGAWVKEMDRTGKVDGIFKRLRAMGGLPKKRGTLKQRTLYLSLPGIARKRLGPSPRRLPASNSDPAVFPVRPSENHG